MTTATRLRRHEPVRLVRPWNGHSRGVVGVDLGAFVRVIFTNGAERLEKLFPRTSVMTEAEHTAARERQAEFDRAAQVKRVRFITVSPLWAALFWIGAKQNETRHWPTSYRGWLGIHAGAKLPVVEQQLAQQEPFRSVLAASHLTPETLPRSCVVMVARVYDCVSATAAAEGWKGHPHELAFGHYAPGGYAWLLHQHRVLPTPVPAKGAQGFWDCDWLPAAVNVALGDEVLPTTESGRRAYYRGGVGQPRALEAGA